MEDTTTKNKKNFFQNFGLMACSMLVIYEVCIICMGASTFWGWNRWEQNISVVSTSTTIAHSTEQSQFEVVDRFDNTSGLWRVGDIEIDGRWDGTMEIKEGVYILKVNEVKKPFIQHNSSFSEFPLKDFDVYLDTKFTMGVSGDVCGGLVFRRSFKGWGHGAYVFIICNDSTFKIAYYDEQGWKTFSGKRFNKAILPSDWNRIEINARGSHFNFSINNMAVYELTDDRQAEGALGIMIEVNDLNPTEVWFDNFGYQTR
jgi:hypothetical protein